MRKIMLCAAAFMLMGITPAFCQEDSTRYINGLPVSEDDTVGRFPENDLGSKTVLIPLQLHELPSRLLKVLNKEVQYTGWQDSTIYFERNTRLYHIHVKYPQGVKIFGLNENGDPVTFREIGRRGSRE